MYTISYVTERMPTKIERSLHYVTPDTRSSGRARASWADRLMPDPSRERDFVVPKKFPKLVVELRRALFYGFAVTQWNLTVYVNG